MIPPRHDKTESRIVTGTPDRVPVATDVNVTLAKDGSKPKVGSMWLNEGKNENHDDYLKAARARRGLPRRRLGLVGFSGALLVLLGGFSIQGVAQPNGDTRWRTEPIHPIDGGGGLDGDIVKLGERLFHDPGLSRDGDIACATCHLLAEGGDDNRSVSIGTDGARTDFNSPTVFNAGNGFRQFWDGRAATLEEQVDFPLTHPGEMATDWATVLSRLDGDASYRTQFEQAFGRPPDAPAVRQALADFQRSLVTPDAPFDRWLRGETDAISELAKQGYRKFKQFGCASCHQGRGVGGNMYAPLGVIVEDLCAQEAVRDADLGRYRITGDDADRCLFKVPSLRNVAVTAPYFHDGSVPSLEAAILLMGHYQLGRRIDAEDTAALVAFLKTLTGTWRGRSLDDWVADAESPTQ